jgi:nitroimidazol reductase NimA-like FMN-containing flavoprotein (pyridoxamine 5'-phosphate oxidase superfamily)
MRRQDRQVSDPVQVDSIIVRGRFCTFALVDGEAPYVCTLSYGYDACGRRLYSHVAHEGRKLDVIRRQPVACGTIIIDHGYTQGECEHPYESVVMEGVFRIVEEIDEKQHALQVLIAQLEDDPGAYWESRGLDESRHVERFTALCFEISSVSAKQGK